MSARPMRPLFALAAAAWLAVSAPAHAAFDAAPWRADYAWLKAELERSYSHLAWFGSVESSVDLPALDRATQRRLDSAQTDAEAADALRDFVAGFHDGHFSEQPALEAAAPAPPATPRDVTRDDARSGCAALGYGHRNGTAFSAPFDALAGFAPADPAVEPGFRAGLVTLANGHRIGIVRIQRFRAAEFPEICQAVWPAAPAERTAETVQGRVEAAMMTGLAARLRDFRKQGAGSVLVDTGGNGGGNDLGDWMARLFTPRPVRSAPLLMAAEARASGYFDEQLEALRAARKLAGVDRRTAAALDFAIGAFEASRAAATAAPCDMSWVWRERRAWKAVRGGCDRLVPGGYASGALAYADDDAFSPAEAQSALYWPAIVGPARGAWNGPAYVLTDSRTGSAAEAFVAVMRDNAIARTVGVKTGGMGCGFMTEAPPLILPASRLRFREPDCVRLRADGTDEVAGIAPDLPVLSREGESETQRAARILAAIDADAAKGLR